MTVGDRTLHVDLARKSVRKAVRTLLEHGEQNIALIIQGSLAADNHVEEAGITAQVKIQVAVAAYCIGRDGAICIIAVPGGRRDRRPSVLG